MLMIEPPPPAIMPGRKPRIMWYIDFTLSSKAASHSSGSTSSTVPPGTEPAQLNSTCTRPARRANSPMARASRTSSTCGSQPATLRTAAASMSAASTRAPARAKASALARPMPEPAAVTTAVLPLSRSDSIGLSGGSRVDLLALGRAQSRQQHFAGLVPLFIRAHQLAHRPVAAPQQARGAETLHQVIDAIRQHRGVGAAGLGHQPGKLADRARLA